MKIFFWLMLVTHLAFFSSVAYAADDEGSDQIYGSTQNTSRFKPRTDLSMDERVAVLERQIDNLNQKNQSSQLSDLQTQIGTLQGRVDVLEHSLHDMQDQMKQQYQDFDARLQTLQTASNKSTVNSANAFSKKASTKLETTENTLGDPSNAAATDINSPAEQASYQKAFNYLKKKDYVRALPAFQDFLIKYPQGNFAPNAYFWIGEINLMQGQPEDAAAAYLKVIRNFPNSDKVQMAQLKLAFAYRDSGKKAQSRAQFKKVIKLYPNTQAAKLATKQLAQPQVS